MKRQRRSRGRGKKPRAAEKKPPEPAAEAPVPVALAKPEPKKLPVAIQDLSLTRFDGLPMQAETHLKMSVLVREHGLHNVHSVVWMPNRADSHRRHVPSGFAFAVRRERDVPIVCELFNPDKFFYGALAVRVPSDTHMRGDRTFRDWAEAPDLDQFGAVVPQGLLDFPGAYVGMYRALRRRPYAKAPYEHEYWAVLQCGAVEQSRTLYQAIEEGHSYEHTWAQTLFSSNMMGQTGVRASDHRRTAVLGILRGLGLEMGNRTLDSFVTIETATNCFDEDHNTETFVYHSGCTPLSQQTGGAVVLGERPDLGPTLLQGPGGKRTWTVPDAYLGAFPVGTGRVSSVLGPWSDNETLDGPFCWDGGLEIHPRLRAGMYRTRDLKFKQTEALLGYNHMWEAVHLQPLAVKLANPDIYNNKKDFI